MSQPEETPSPALVNYALLLAKRLRAQPRHVVMQRKEKIAALVILEGSAIDKVIEELERLAGKGAAKPKAERGKRK